MKDRGISVQNQVNGSVENKKRETPIQRNPEANVYLVDDLLLKLHFIWASSCCRVAPPVVAGPRLGGQDLVLARVSSPLIFDAAVSWLPWGL